MREASLGQVRAIVAARLRERRGEIEEATLTRVYAVSEQLAHSDSEYSYGLRAVVSAALEHGLSALEQSEDQPPPVPAVLLAQARLAAREGVTLDTVLRRYFAGYTLLGDYVIQGGEQSGLLRGAALQKLLRGQAALFDRVIAAVSEEYSREKQRRLGSTEQRHADRVVRLLAGELLDTSELGYEFGVHHLGAIATGPEAAQALTTLAKTLDRRLLFVARPEGAIWAWLGSSREFDAEEVEGRIARDWPNRVALALGEPAAGLTGWRLTHRQARAALPIALRSPQRFARYANVALLASMLRDGLLTTSLRELYLAPLSDERDGGDVLRETVRAYCEAERNISSAASALGVNRHTVTNRLRSVEERLGRPLSTCITELDAALRLETLEYPIPHKVV